MESNVRFRNHLSIVVERLGVFVGVAVMFLISNVDAASDLLSAGMSTATLVPLLLGAGAILAMLVAVVGYNVWVWSRTWISLVDGSIVIERNTMHQKKNTIGIKNISNVNTEQNIFEMLIGTCKVKLDTNSLSTADSTDVKIVLKKADAEAFRLQVMALMQGCEEAAVIAEDSVDSWDYEASTQDIIMHGLFSVRLSVVLIAIGSMAALFATTVLTLRHGAFVESLGSLLVNVLLFGGMAFSAIRNLVMGFLKYYDFKISRRGDKLVLRYGLFKKVHYTIPVSKINGLIVHQSLSARVAGYAMAELINIGMGDDESEAEAFLCPYSKRDVTMARIQEFLPELSQVVSTDYVRQPHGVWFVWLWQMVCVAFCAAAVAIAGEWLLAYWQMGAISMVGLGLGLDGMLREWVVIALWSAVALVVAFAVVRRVLRYKTEGISLGEHYILIVRGAFARSYCWISYRKVQYIRLVDAPVSRLMRICKGRLNILAQVRNQSQRLPYMPIDNGLWLKDKILKR